MNNKRVACYVRVSTENQLENYSIDEQIDRLTAYCKAKDYYNVKFYTDGGYSGGNINRPALKNMISDIENGKIHIVIVYKLDRLSRSQKDTLLLIEDTFTKNNVGFISMNENFDTTTPFGKAMIGILSVFAQLEKDQITERFTMGRIGRAKSGLYHGGSTIPTGYDYVDGKLIVNEYEALQIRELFELFNSGKSILSIQKYMSGKYTTKHGAWSSESLVRKILKNPLYIGKVKFKGEYYDGIHTPIVSKDVFNLANNLLSSVERTNNYTSFQKTPFKANNLLTSIIYCKRCGARFSGEHGNYTCYSRSKNSKRQIKDPNCKNKKWKIAELDQLITEYISTLEFENIETETNKSEINSNTISKRLKEIDQQIERMIDLFQVSNIPIDQIQKRVDSLTKEKETLNESLSNHDDKLSISAANSIKEKFLDLKESGSLEEKRLLINRIIKRIDIDGEDVDIHLNI